MAYTLTYTSTRPDTSEDWYFFKEGADAGVETNSTHFRNWLDARSDVTVTLTVAEDNLLEPMCSFYLFSKGSYSSFAFLYGF